MGCRGGSVSCPVAFREQDRREERKLRTRCWAFGGVPKAGKGRRKERRTDLLNLLSHPKPFSFLLSGTIKLTLFPALLLSGSVGEIITANRTHATTLFHSHSGLPITQTFKNQPSLSLPSTPSISSALHSPSVSAALAELVPGFKYFSERTKEEGREQKGGRDVWAKGLPRATTMQRVLRERGVRREEEDKEVRSLRGETL